MKDIDCHAIFALLEEAADALGLAVRRMLRTLRRMSWPALLLSCLLLALLATIVPLAITLFVIFMAIKLAVGAIAINRRRQRNRQRLAPQDAPR
jgi:glucose-6-phosphate-specific signal transduction histidine kinase